MHWVLKGWDLTPHHSIPYITYLFFLKKILLFLLNFIFKRYLSLISNFSKKINWQIFLMLLTHKIKKNKVVCRQIKSKSIKGQVGK